MITVVDSDALRLERELRAVVRGEVHFEDGYRAMYSTDAANYRQVPICVVLPRDADDARAAMAVCHRRNPFLHASAGLVVEMRPRRRLGRKQARLYQAVGGNHNS